ncbi:MAG TPA: hypothetical protein VH724_12265 [Candidatus Angelobacter sp.]|nr:hypothetical protein [Candidatus Angelobacter sp.]
MKLDELMPRYDVKAAYSIRIAAPPQRVWQEIMNADFSNLPVARRLMALRTFGRRKKSPAGQPRTLETMGARGAGGFLEVARIPEQEMVLAIIGRFWRPDAPVLRDWQAEEFSVIAPRGMAKAVWNFYLVPAESATELSTETRVQCFGQSTRLKFRLYWTMIGFFSGLIRKEMLEMVKRNSERPADLT